MKPSNIFYRLTLTALFAFSKVGASDSDGELFYYDEDGVAHKNFEIPEEVKILDEIDAVSLLEVEKRQKELGSKFTRDEFNKIYSENFIYRFHDDLFRKNAELTPEKEVRQSKKVNLRYLKDMISRAKNEEEKEKRIKEYKAAKRNSKRSKANLNFSRTLSQPFSAANHGRQVEANNAIPLEI